jgi:hypothetical protein
MKTWKIQKFFGDVVYDLRNRGLLPVVILLVIAMIAVPVLITRGGSSSHAPSLQPASSSDSKAALQGQNAVVSYSPSGIRRTRQRLSDQLSKNPFRQQFKHASNAAASQLNSTVNVPDSSASASTTSPTTTGTPSTGSATTGSGGSAGSGEKKSSKKKTTYSYQVNVLAGDVTTTLTPFNNVAAMTPLPSQTAPVVLYYSLTADNKQAQFLVSNKVGSLSGPGTCVPSPDDCALLTLAPGQSEDLTYATDGKTYRIVVASIKRIAK